jgi:DNA replication protein DnaC
VYSVDDHIRAVDAVITANIDGLSNNRKLLSQNLLSNLRNLVEGVAVRLHTTVADTEYNYQSAIVSALRFVRSKGQYSFLGRFHKLLQASASHYTLEGDASERLMLKYYEYLHRIRNLMQDHFGVGILSNLEKFPVDLDPSLAEYHQKIATRIEAIRSSARDRGNKSRYYLQRVKPFFVGGRVYYEVTFSNAVNRVSKFDRIIAFTDIEMTDKYAANLTLLADSIDVLGQTMPITIIRDWEVSIRPCEFNNFARLFGQSTAVKSGSPEYLNLMRYLTTRAASLLDLTDLPDDQYVQVMARITRTTQRSQILPVLDLARRLVRAREPGCHVIRYLMLRMNNQILKLQYTRDECKLLSRLRLSYGCKPFDDMPFCTSLRGHNPRFSDLVESLETDGRPHEILARRVKNNVERRGTIYTPIGDVEELGDVDELVARYNSKVYYKHADRKLVKDNGHVFIKEYEDGTVSIIKKLQELASTGVDGYQDSVERWLNETPLKIDDTSKQEALTQLFKHSRVALIYGAAGTGKSTMVNYIASHLSEKPKLFLAHTNPAVDNLIRRVEGRNSTFRTISSHLRQSSSDPEYDVLVIDECSTVSNSSLLEVLANTKFKLLVLVGDVYQIESIQFGNWFATIRSFIPSTSVFELTTPYRTTNRALLELWSKVRNLDDDIEESLARNSYSTELNDSLFEPQQEDEIILCLNYDGLYGINNINRFLQGSNPCKAVHWGASTYKVGDPVLFNETDRFRPVIYNNLKGRIVDIARFPGRIQFDVKLERSITELHVDGSELRWKGDSTVQFDVYELDNTDEDDDSVNTSVPFQVAYAVSIHKAQGLEYDSVKIVVTEANKDNTTHSVLYTAITRARERLRIYWTPETQSAVLSSLERIATTKDVALMQARRGVVPAAT